MMKNAIKRWIVLLLTVLLCLLVVGCDEKLVPMDEDGSSLIGVEGKSSYLEQEETLESEISEVSSFAESNVESGQESLSVAETSRTTVESVLADQKDPKQESLGVAESSKTVAESVSEEQKGTESNLSFNVSEVVPPVQFSEPPEDTVATDHVEQSLEEFLAWLNSDEALTEGDGALANAVNFYRKREGIPLVFTSVADQKVKYYRLYWDGRLGVGFQDYGLIISPFSAEKVVSARDGIVSYLKSDGKTVTQAMQPADLLAITSENPNYYVQRSVTIGSKQIDAVYHIRRTELQNQIDTSTQPIFIRHLHWIQDGFYVELSLRSTYTAEKAWNYDQEFVSSLSFKEVALSDSPLQAAK